MTYTSSHTLDTGNKFVQDIFSTQSFYNIPMYQRPYVWGKEQVTVLLDDIYTALQRDAEKEYFLGCMVWNTKEKKDKDSGIVYTSQDILDGQQRFITLYLLQGVIRDLSSDEKHREDINKDLYQEGKPRRGLPERCRVVFEVRRDAYFLKKYLIEDNGTLKLEALKATAKDKKASISVRNMAASILTMHNWWKDLRDALNEGEDFQRILDEFYTYLSRKVMLLYLATPDNLDDAYNLFTVLNSRGIQLRVSDILRAQHLRVIDDPVTQRIYAEKWTRFEDVITEPFRNFDEFLWVFIRMMMKYNSSDNKTILAGFKYMEKRGFFKAGMETIDCIEDYVNHYEALTNHSLDTPKYGHFFSNLNRILIHTFGYQHFSILMQYLERFGNHRMVELLVKVDNLLTAAWLVGRRLPPQRIHAVTRRIDEYHKKVKLGRMNRVEAANAFLEDRVLMYSYVNIKSKAKPVDLKTTFTLFEEDDVGGYGGTKTSKVRYLLLKLDLLFGDLKQTLHFERSQCSIEHIMPRKIKKETWEVSKEQHEQWVNKLGNLLLLNKKRNTSVSTKPYLEKRAILQNSGTEHRAYAQQVLERHDHWDLDTLEENHSRVVEILRYYYLQNNADVLFSERLTQLKGATSPVE